MKTIYFMYLFLTLWAYTAIHAMEQLQNQINEKRNELKKLKEQIIEQENNVQQYEGAVQKFLQTIAANSQDDIKNFFKTLYSKILFKHAKLASIDTSLKKWTTQKREHNTTMSSLKSTISDLEYEIRNIPTRKEQLQESIIATFTTLKRISNLSESTPVPPQKLSLDKKSQFFHIYRQNFTQRKTQVDKILNRLKHDSLVQKILTNSAIDSKKLKSLTEGELEGTYSRMRSIIFTDT